MNAAYHEGALPPASLLEGERTGEAFHDWPTAELELEVVKEEPQEP